MNSKSLPSFDASQLSLDLCSLRAAYASAALTPLALVDALYARLAATPHAGVFIHQLGYEHAADAARELMRRAERGEPMALYGVPFVVKDNIDVAGLDTTAACPAFAHRATQSASVVARLLVQGALLLGKTNLDQFATGLVGVRSPYGIVHNPFDERYLSGGSSSGSAVAVARGFCSFALGTDTAGSGRVPAAFNNLVGLKPTRGMLSAHGVVPACRSLDCVSVFALCVDDACEVAHAMAGFDAKDPYARASAARWDPRPGALPPHFRFAQPMAAQLLLNDDADRVLFERATARVQSLGGQAREIDLAPFHAVAALLYGGPWAAERLEAAGEILERQPSALLPVIAEILSGAAQQSAQQTFDALHQLEQLKQLTNPLWDSVDFLLVPTTPGIHRIEDVLREPIRLNSELGTYTNFVNLLDLCALSVPAGFRADGLPFGVTLISRAGRDALLASYGRQLQAELGAGLGAGLGAMAWAQPPLPPAAAIRSSEDRVALAVVGAHLSGQPLNHQLTDLGGRLLSATRTAASYRLYALPTQPAKPGLVRVSDGDGPGHAIELEVWELSNAALGSFMRGVGAPLCIGSVELADGTRVLGFLCESAATRGQPEISALGGWRAYLASLRSS